MIIVYSSKSGSSKKYAEILSQRTGFPIFPVDSNLPQGEGIIFFGWLKKDTVIGLKYLDRTNLEAVCVVGLDSEGRFDAEKVSSYNGYSAPTYYLRGWIDRSKLTILDKTILLAVSVMMKLKGLNQFNQPIFDAMMVGGSFFDESYIDSIELFCKSDRSS